MGKVRGQLLLISKNAAVKIGSAVEETGRDVCDIWAKFLKYLIPWSGEALQRFSYPFCNVRYLIMVEPWKRPRCPYCT
jgi:hypothetical protein